MDRPDWDSDSAAGLHPPHLRQTYTPPPQKDKDFKGLNVDDTAACASSDDFTPSSSPSPSHKAAKRRKHPHHRERDSESAGAMIRRGIVEHQLGLSVNLMLLVAFSYLFFPSLRPRMSAFFWLSYPKDGVRFWYGQGPRDLALVASFAVFFTAVRAFCLDYVLLPLAGAAGIRNRKGRVRFAEQSYMLLYYIVYWFWGLSLFVRNTPADVRGVEGLLRSLWTGWPRLYVGGGMKAYYLSQLAFWAQQIVVIHIEARRKDHNQMLAHHIITVTLLSFSYPFRHWRVGNAILVCMDVVDLVLPLAKILRYLDLQAACDAAFACFVVVWLIARHAAYLAICWSLYAHVHARPDAALRYGRYSTRTGVHMSTDAGEAILDEVLQPLLHPDALGVAFNGRIRTLFLTLLLGLQCLTIAWFVMICRVVMRVLRGNGATDSRSDGETSDGGYSENAEDENGEDDDDENIAVPMKAAAGDSQQALSSHPQPEPSAPYTLSPAATLVESERHPLPRFIEVESSSEIYQTYSPRIKAGGVSGGAGAGALGSSGGNGGSSAKRKSKGISSGLNLGEHKALLNRIGCLSPEQLAREREKREQGGASSGAVGRARSESASPRPDGG